MKQRAEKYIMGTQIEIMIEADVDVNKDIQKSFEIFSDFEREFSRFSVNSDLTKLNKQKDCLMSQRFIKILKLAKDIHRETQGYFNPLLDLSIIWYTESFEKQIFQKQEKQINLDLDTVEIQGNKIILQENQNLDLWWIVKWYCVDYVYDFLFKAWYTNFIINAGGDIRIAWKYTLAVDSPMNNWDIFALLDIENKAISTSGTYKRKWEIGKQQYHHILSPEKDIAHDDIVSISLISDNCYISDAYATACIAMWYKKASDFLKRQKIDGIIITKDMKYHRVVAIKKYNLEII